MDRKKLFIIGIALVLLLFFGWRWQHNAVENMQPAVDGKSQLKMAEINKDPALTLLHGKLILMSESTSQQVTTQDVYQGMAYILVQSKDNISATSGSVLSDASKVRPVTDMALFQQIGRASQGILSLQQINNAHLALAYYNVNGWLLLKAINNLDFESLVYDVNNKTVILKSQDHIQGKNLYGKLQEYN